MDRIMKDILRERSRQDIKWGIQDHPLPIWLAILIEEVGEVGKAIFEELSVRKVREELIQVAAVAVAIVEAMDQGEYERV